jgi:spermidine synthase
MGYPGGIWSFSFASKGLHPLQDFDPDRVTASGLAFKYYNAAIHQAAFALPSFMRDRLRPWLTV